MTNFNRNGMLILIVALQLMVMGCGNNSTAESPVAKDAVALSGVTAGKGYFDINLAEANKLALYLNVIKQAHESLITQGVSPNFIIAFRGPSVKLITTTAASADLKAQIAGINSLSNVRMEACAVAAGIFGVDKSTILPDIVPVGNTFISSIGYQAKGYSPILIQ